MYSRAKEARNIAINVYEKYFQPCATSCVTRSKIQKKGKRQREEILRRSMKRKKENYKINEGTRDERPAVLLTD